ncbi:hypothetical protein BH09MYX1_BH09MYX1_50740 [soil metagenome]
MAGITGTCARCQAPTEEHDLRCAVCAFPTPDTGTTHAREAAAAILRCEQCGAATSYSPEAQGARCTFCAAVLRLEQPVDPVESAESLVPFAVDLQTAQVALRQWMASLGFFRPSDLSSGASIAALTPLYWAAWIVQADALVSWAADSNYGANNSVWAPHAGQTPMQFRNVIVSASRGLGQTEWSMLGPHYDLRTLGPLARSEDERLTERFDVQRSAARGYVVDAVHQIAAQNLERGIIPGSAFRNVKVALVLRGLTTARVGLPVYILAYRYQNKLYRAIVHGQNARIVKGSAPYSWWKILGVAAAVASVLVFLFVILVAFASTR